MEVRLNIKILFLQLLIIIAHLMINQLLITGENYYIQKMEASMHKIKINIPMM
nr:hypothetical protein [Fusobacterium animalis]